MTVIVSVRVIEIETGDDRNDDAKERTDDYHRPYLPDEDPHRWAETIDRSISAFKLLSPSPVDADGEDVEEEEEQIANWAMAVGRRSVEDATDRTTWRSTCYSHR